MSSMTPGKKNLLIGGGVLAVGAVAVAGLLAFSGGSAEPASSGGSSVNVDRATVRQDRAPTVATVAAIDQADAASAAAAQKKGGSFVPPSLSAPVAISPMMTDSSSAASSAPPTIEQQQRFMLEEQRRVQEADRTARLQQDADARRRTEEEKAEANAMKQLGMIAKLNEPPETASIRMPGRSAAQASSAGAAPASSGVADLIKARVVVKPLEIMTANLISPIDTAKTARVNAQIVGGPLDGALLIGQAQLVGEGLLGRFSLMRHKDKAYKVDVTMLDEGTSLDALEKGVSVDRRYLERWVMPIAMAAVGGYYEAKSKPGQTVISGIGGSTVATPSSSADQARASGLSKGISMTERQVERAAEAPMTARVSQGTTIGIIFNAEVTE